MLALALIFAMCMIVESSDTSMTRVARTLPLNLSPSRWSGTFRTLWSTGRIWELPRKSVESFARLVSLPDTSKKMFFEFRPDDGPRASYAYQRRYGYRGQWLIELLGSGYHPDQVVYLEPLPPAVLVPPPLPF